ncbi:hypothetical protein B0T18DRAFT_390726 [Schizothecium vesticola]|uniref:Uncharacterized protein n=1 Tax=Schizothecium vesticola TaxID=314040 RepID=A0AA40EVC5_9PEZI|nr:hypothetical protein B0T18DRAFT_390726 [Schizothecium vesticola]
MAWHTHGLAFPSPVLPLVRSPTAESWPSPTTERSTTIWRARLQIPRIQEAASANALRQCCNAAMQSCEVHSEFLRGPREELLRILDATSYPGMKLDRAAQTDAAKT